MSKPVECITPRVNPNVNYGLWVIMMCQCRFIDWNKYTTVIWDADSGGGCVYVGIYLKSLYFPVNFALILKLL